MIQNGDLGTSSISSINSTSDERHLIVCSADAMRVLLMLLSLPTFVFHDEIPLKDVSHREDCLYYCARWILCLLIPHFVLIFTLPAYVGGTYTDLTLSQHRKCADS